MCLVAAPAALSSSTEQFLGRHAQCSSMEGERAAAPVGKPFLKRKVRRVCGRCQQLHAPQCMQCTDCDRVQAHANAVQGVRGARLSPFRCPSPSTHGQSSGKGMEEAPNPESTHQTQLELQYSHRCACMPARGQAVVHCERVMLRHFPFRFPHLAYPFCSMMEVSSSTITGQRNYLSLVTLPLMPLVEASCCHQVQALGR